MTAKASRAWLEAPFACELNSFQRRPDSAGRKLHSRGIRTGLNPGEHDDHGFPGGIFVRLSGRLAGA